MKNLWMPLALAAAVSGAMCGVTALCTPAHAEITYLYEYCAYTTGCEATECTANPACTVHGATCGSGNVHAPATACFAATFQAGCQVVNNNQMCTITVACACVDHWYGWECKKPQFFDRDNTISYETLPYYCTNGQLGGPPPIPAPPQDPGGAGN